MLVYIEPVDTILTAKFEDNGHFSKIAFPSIPRNKSTQSFK